MNVSAKLVRISRIMAALAGIGAVFYLAMEILVFAAPDAANAITGASMHTDLPINGKVPMTYRLSALAFDLIPTALVVWALLELRRLFQFYTRGQVFSEGALRSLNRVAMLMFIEVLVAFRRAGARILSHQPRQPAGPASCLSGLRLERSRVPVHGRCRSGDRARDGRGRAASPTKTRASCDGDCRQPRCDAGQAQDAVQGIGRAHRHHRANLSLLKSGKVKGVRFETLDKICAVLDCQPGDLLEHRGASAEAAE